MNTHEKDPQGPDNAMEHASGQNFCAVLTPHRSLTRGGFLTVMGLIVAVNFVAGTAFALIGAWPVAGFAGLDVLIIWWAFRRNFADGNRSERIEITPHELILQQVMGAKPPSEQRFLRGQVRIELDEDRERELVGGLFLRTGAMRTEIGSFLPPDEKRDLSAVLRQALIRA
jgi:uncharacterized membrane protein